MAGVGVLNGMFVIFGLTSKMDYKISYAISGSICILIAIALFFCISDKHYEKKS